MFRGCYISNIDSNNIQQNCVKHVGLNALIYAHEHLTWTPKQLRHTLMVRFRFMIILDIRSPAAVFIDIYIYIYIYEGLDSLVFEVFEWSNQSPHLVSLSVLLRCPLLELPGAVWVIHFALCLDNLLLIKQHLSLSGRIL